MSKIKIKNSSFNNLFTYLKDNNINFDNKKNQDNVETIEFFPVVESKKQELLSILNNYGTKIYHDTVLDVNLIAEPRFNYVSNQYENIIINNTERDLPLFYVENTNEQNERHADLKTIEANVVSKEYMKKIGNSQNQLSAGGFRNERMRNVYFGKDFSKQRSKNYIDEFPYYNEIIINSQENNNFIGSLLHDIDFYEEILEDLLNPKESLTTNFLINNTDNREIETYDFIETINQSIATINEQNKVILSKNEKGGNHTNNNFNKFLILNKLNPERPVFTKNFQQMYDNELCEKEFILYKIEKYRKQESTPMQSIWMHDIDFKEFYDYQIKLNISYRYVLKVYTIIYGTASSISNVRDSVEGSRNTLKAIKADFTYTPSYRMGIFNFGEISFKNIPNPPMSPSVRFFNESNSQNYIKIYLDLKNHFLKENFIEITEEDATLIENVKRDSDGKINFQYYLEDGKFEVFRIKNKPTSYSDFENAKTLDIKSMISSTGVMFKDRIKPNEKYYYMFRALNTVGVPSNPTPIYEVELIKNASKSKIIVNTIKLEKEMVFKDKTFKSLLQISPAFDQHIFDEFNQTVVDLETFDKKINQLTLGTATDKVWGKKFKIRVKSKDTGKIIDLNVKFNLIKDNIK